MKIQRRNSVFETNSSSTHALCIPKSDEKLQLPRTQVFHFRGNDYDLLEGEIPTQQDRADFFYTILTLMPLSYFRVSYFKNFMYAHDILPIFEEPKIIPENLYDYDSDFDDLINDLLEDHHKLFRFLFSNDVVSIYTDRDYEPEMDRIHALERSGKYDMFMRYDL